MAEMGARSWFRVPAFPHYRYFRHAGARERKFHTGTWESGTQKNRNVKFTFLWRDDTFMTCTERWGGRGELWTRHEFEPASTLVHCARLTKGVMSCSSTPTHTLGTRNRNAEKMLYRNVGMRNAKEKSRSAGTRERKGPQERVPNAHLWLMVHYFLSDLTDLTINGCNFQKFKDQCF